MPPLTKQQHEQRRGKVGASIVASILGLNPWHPPIDAYLELTGQRQQPNQELVRKANWGHTMEAVVVEWYEQRTGRKCEPAPTLLHAEHDWAIATPDRVVIGQPALLEAKNVGSRVSWHWFDGVPEYVTTQAVWQMWVARSHGTPFERVDVVAAVGGNPPEIFRVPWDEDLASMMFEAVQDFYVSHVVPRVQPPVDGSSAYREFLRRMFPESNGELVDAPEAERWATIYDNAGQAEKSAKAARQEARNHLLAIIGDNDGARFEGGIVTMRKAKDGKRAVRVSFEWQKELKEAAA